MSSGCSERTSLVSTAHAIVLMGVQTCGFLSGSCAHILCGEGDVNVSRGNSSTSTGPTELQDHNPRLGVFQGSWISYSTVVPIS